jgi:hypothetical protein
VSADSTFDVYAPTVKGTAGFVTVRLALPVAVEFAALYAVTVQVPVPAPDVLTVMLPDVPEPEPEACPEQATDALVAFDVVQVNVAVEPDDTEDVLNDAPDTDGAATTLMLAPPVDAALAALYAVTLHVAVPGEDVPTEMLPEVPEPVAVAPAPEQETDAEVAPVVDQLNVLAFPAVTGFVLKNVYPDPCTVAGATTLKLADAFVELPAAL